MPVNSEIDVESTPDDVEEAGLPINELFYSLQGEGMLAGTPSVFIRTSGCNLRCWFCDSYHTSWEPTHAFLELDDIIEEVESYDAEHVVVTGGEPMIHDEAGELLDQLGSRGYHTTVETNGTIYRDTHVDLASISPKLSSSTPTEQRDPKGDGEWADRHENRRINLEALSNLVETYDYQLKFVVTGRDDMDEITELLEQLRGVTSAEIRGDNVLLMPEGVTREELNNTRGTVADLALEYGYRYTPRIHVDLWNDAPGT